MSGFFSRIIKSLLGEKEGPEKDIEKLKEVKAALSSPPGTKRPEPAGMEEEGSAIYRMIERAYRRMALFLSEKFRNKNTVALSGVAIAAIILIISFTPFFFYLRGVFLAILFILVAAASKLIQKLFPFVVGFDMCLFFTVLVGIAYHPLAGIAVGVISSTLGSIIRGQYDMTNVILPNIGYITAGALLPLFAGSSIIFIGMALTAVYVILMSIIFWFKYAMINQTATFVITSLLFNYWLFSNYSSYFLMLMGFNS